MVYNVKYRTESGSFTAQRFVAIDKDYDLGQVIVDHLNEMYERYYDDVETDGTDFWYTDEETGEVHILMGQCEVEEAPYEWFLAVERCWGTDFTRYGQIPEEEALAMANKAWEAEINPDPNNQFQLVLAQADDDGEPVEDTVMESHDIWKLHHYVVYWTGGERDGETLGYFSEERDAISFAEKFYSEHEDEFDPVCGGVGIDDNISGAIVEW